MSSSGSLTPNDLNPVPFEEPSDIEAPESPFNPSQLESAILSASQINQRLSSQLLQKKSKQPQVVFNISHTRYPVVRDVGYEQFDWIVSENGDTEWDVIWVDCSLDTVGFSRLKPFQKINCFPGVYCVARKDRLSINLGKLKKRFPEEYSFFPETFILPSEYKQFKSQLSKNNQQVFIIKPQASSQGKGIFLTDTWKSVNQNEKYVAQKYLKKPFILEGLKFDLRIYVLVTSCDPLQIYIFEDGLARFATHPYQAPGRNNMNNMYMHLTNYAINKDNPGFIFNNSTTNDGQGHKRSLKALWKTLEEKGYDVASLWESIKQIVVKTFCSVQPILNQNYKSHLFTKGRTDACFQVFGFDIILDENMKPWLLEVNSSPSFSTGTPLDQSIKERVIGDALKVMKISAEDRINYKKKLKNIIEMRSINGKPALARSQGTSSKCLIGQDKKITKLGGYELIFPREGDPQSVNYEAFLDEASKSWSSSLGVYTYNRDNGPTKELEKAIERSLVRELTVSFQEHNLIKKQIPVHSPYMTPNNADHSSRKPSFSQMKKRTPSREVGTPNNQSLGPLSFHETACAYDPSLLTNKKKDQANHNSYSVLDYRTTKDPQTEISGVEKEPNRSIDSKILERYETPSQYSFFQKTQRMGVGRTSNRPVMKNDAMSSGSLLIKSHTRPASATSGSFAKKINIPKGKQDEQLSAIRKTSSRDKRSKPIEKFDDRSYKQGNVAVQIPEAPREAIKLEQFSLQKISLDPEPSKTADNYFPKRFSQQLSQSVEKNLNFNFSNKPSYPNANSNRIISLKTLETIGKKGSKKDFAGNHAQSYAGLVKEKSMKAQQSTAKFNNFLIPQIYGHANPEFSKTAEKWKLK